MNYLYSLYDALVSINVPSDKARAVVDAMEHEMGTTLATKSDLQALSLATRKDVEAFTLASKKDVEALALGVKKDIEIVRMALQQELEMLRQEMNSRFRAVDQRFDALRTDITREIAASELKMTVKLGSMLLVGFSLTIAALRVWP